MDLLYIIDEKIFSLINRGLANPLLDSAMPFFVPTRLCITPSVPYISFLDSLQRRP